MECIYSLQITFQNGRIHDNQFRMIIGCFTRRGCVPGLVKCQSVSLVVTGATESTEVLIFYDVLKALLRPFPVSVFGSLSAATR